MDFIDPTSTNTSIYWKRWTNIFFALYAYGCVVFTHFFTNDLIDKIVVQTNLHASQLMTEESFSNWEKTTVEELKANFGFYILMGINHFPSLDDYSKLVSVLHYSPVADKITC